MDKEALMELKGTNGTIIAYDNRIVIKRKGFLAFMSGGFRGDRTYYYNNTTVEYRKPTFFINGYLKMIVAGTFDRDARVGLLGSSHKSLKDPNTVILRAIKKGKAKQSEELYTFIMKKITHAQTNTTTLTSNLDELKKLAELRDANIITEQEFNEQKEKLLNN